MKQTSIKRKQRRPPFPGLLAVRQQHGAASPPGSRVPAGGLLPCKDGLSVAGILVF